jgi:hypothetical protein
MENGNYYHNGVWMVQPPKEAKSFFAFGGLGGMLILGNPSTHEIFGVTRVSFGTNLFETAMKDKNAPIVTRTDLTGGLIVLAMLGKNSVILNNESVPVTQETVTFLSGPSQPFESSTYGGFIRESLEDTVFYTLGGGSVSLAVWMKSLVF